MSLQLPPPPLERPGVVAWVAEHLGGLFSGEPEPSARFVGGQAAADRALAAFEVAGYAGKRNEVWPEERRGASALSPYIRHGLLPLPMVWEAVADGPSRDVRKFRDELLWQEYSRHLYARVGRATKRGLRRELWGGDGNGWNREMACIRLPVDELETDGWLVNQTRMWLASHWAVREGVDWRQGEDIFFRHLLDGSRAANRLGWQWTVGTATNRTYGFSRWQVEKRAPGLCATCPYGDECPIEGWPDDPPLTPVDADPRLRSDPDPETTAGPRNIESASEAQTVWLTAESLGDADPALAAHPHLPAVFVFDEPLLQSLQLTAKRLVFLAETLADLSQRRNVEVWRGRPTSVLPDRHVAATWSPVPGWKRRAANIQPAVIHPWPWLHRPHGGPVTSFSAWRKRLDQTD